MMRTGRRILWLLIMVVAVLLCVGAANAAVFREGDLDNGIHWVLDEDGTLTFSGSGVLDVSSFSFTGSAPWLATETDLPPAVVSVVIEEGITKVTGEGVFSSLLALRDVAIADSVTMIDVRVFAGCSGLRHVTVHPSSSQLTSIADWAFSGCTALSQFTIPDHVTSMSGYAFYSCSNLTRISIPAGLTNFLESPLVGCDNLAAINVASAHPQYCSVDGVLFDKNQTELLVYPPAKAGSSYSIPSTVTTIGSSAFSGCTQLTSINIPSSVTQIRYGAFYRCTHLTAIHIPSSVTSIGGEAFRLCSQLMAVNIPDAVVEISPSIFSSCSSLTSIDIPENVISIGATAFAECCSLTAIDIPESVMEIGASAFYGCSSLTTVRFAQNSRLQNIRSHAFSECIRLTQIEIPESVAALTGDVFSGCSQLTEIVVLGSSGPNKTVDGVLFSSDMKTLLRYPANKSDSTYTVPSTVERIDIEAFSGCTHLTGILLPSGLTRIGNDAFSGCTNLTSITIPAAVTDIGYSTFNGCTSLQEVIFAPNSSLEFLDFWAFQGTGLTNITIPASVTSLEYNHNDNHFQSITVENGNANYSSADGVLFNADKTMLLMYPAMKTDTAYTVPSTVHTIEYAAFYDCKNLTELNLSNVSDISGEATFYGCSNLTSVTLPVGVTVIGHRAFGECDKLQTVNYKGTKEQAQEIDYGYGNGTLLMATWICSDAELSPAMSGSADGWSWELTADHVLIISGTGILPERNAAPWFHILDLAESIQINPGVTAIGNSAFDESWFLRTV